LLEYQRSLGRSKGIDSGKQPQEPRPIIEHAFHLSLLEHDFGNEHGVIVIDSTPGKIAI
jgi:hypothetical protein